MMTLHSGMTVLFTAYSKLCHIRLYTDYSYNGHTLYYNINRVEFDSLYLGQGHGSRGHDCFSACLLSAKLDGDDISRKWPEANL